jgi:hypothetical protein
MRATAIALRVAFAIVNSRKDSCATANSLPAGTTTSNS